jgi:S-adenosylmethionine:tRNA ribosyltransferase-isomerase
MNESDFLLSSYDYNLPKSHIAQLPSIPAHNAKMLVCIPKNNNSYTLQHKQFIDLKDELDNKYLIFLNRTKVFKARIPLHEVKIIRKSGKEILLND